MYKYKNSGEVLYIYKQLMGEKEISKFLEVLKSHHNDTYEHSLRVAKLSIDLAIENNLPTSQVLVIGRAALLHDYGKSRIDEELLSKKGPLNLEEKLVMRMHPKLGLEELKEVVSEEVSSIIITHHEYQSHLPTQIVAAADMYDALTFPRSYKSGLNKELVKSIMAEQFTGGAFLINQLVKRVAAQPETTKVQTGQ